MDRPSALGSSRIVSSTPKLSTHRAWRHWWSGPAPSLSNTSTMPPPPPEAGSWTWSVRVHETWVKVPVTVAPDAGTTRSQVCGVAPVQSSAYSANLAPGLSCAGRCTVVFASNWAEQVPEQLIPAGVLTIRPGPITWTVNVPVTRCGRTSCAYERVLVRPSGNVAVTVTWKVRAALHWWSVEEPSAVVASPNSQCAPTGCGAAPALTDSRTSCPTPPGVADTARCRARTARGGGTGDGGAVGVGVGVGVGGGGGGGVAAAGGVGCGAGGPGRG